MNRNLFISFAALLLILASCETAKKESIKLLPTVIENNGVRIDFLSEGTGDTTLFFLHGWGINKTYWKDQVNYFKKNYKVVAIDLPGFGQSGKNRDTWTMEKYGEDVAVVIDSLRLENVILIGHSMSGDIILEAANLRPDKVIGLVGIDNFKEIKKEYSTAESESIESFLNSMRKDYKTTATNYFAATLFHKDTDEKIKKRIMDDLNAADTVVATSTIESVINNLSRNNALLATIPLKLWLINSDYTPTNMDALEKNCQNGYEVLIIHNTGHYPMIEKPGEFNQLLERILKP